jgi:hypothetical protein
MSTATPSSWRAIVAGGLAAGVLDLTAALVLYTLRGARPIRIVQAIASGLLGAEAYKGGVATAALGCLLHFVIAFGAASVFVAASRRLPALVRRPVVWGPLYGVAVYLVMNFVVIPLSAVARGPFNPRLAAILVVIHMLCVGLPIALAARRYAPAT